MANYNPFNILGTAVGNTFSNLTGYGKNDDTVHFTNLFGVRKPADTPSNNPKPPAPKPSPLTTQAGSDAAATSRALIAQINQLTAQINAQPKLPTYDVLGNYTKAKAQATANVTPLYDLKLQQFLNAQATETAGRRSAADLGFENSGITKANTLTDNSTSRDRTGQDLLSALQMIGQSRDNFLEDDGNQFDLARRALQESTAAAGGTDTGLGQQGIDRQLTDRNTNADRQLTTLTQQEATKQLASARSLEDLATSDVRAGQQKTQADKGTQLDLDSYLDTLTNATESKKLDLNLAKANDIASQTGDISKQLAQQFIATLAGKGTRAQDIALAQQVYGRG